MRVPQRLKKPKLEENSNNDFNQQVVPVPPAMSRTEEEEDNSNSIQEQEEALLALLEHRTKEVDHLKYRLSYYQSQLEESEKRLHDTNSKLVCLRSRNKAAALKSSVDSGTKRVEVDSVFVSPVRTKGGFITKTSAGSSTHIKSAPKVKVEKSYGTSSDREVCELKDKGLKRKFEQKEHRELIPMIRASSSPCIIRCTGSNHIPSQHKRKLRSLTLCPVDDSLFVSSALDGVVNLWQLRSKGSGASLLSSTDCLSPKQRRWPEDIVWHPQGTTLLSAYSADGGDSQISVLNLNKTQGRARVTFLEDKPHSKGIINAIIFMPWESTCFVTGGSDHAVVLWEEKDAENSWKTKVLHRNLHSSAVMGVAGLEHKQVVLSVGADKRIIGFDLEVGRTEFKHQIESKCMSVVPNPCDLNLFMVQTGTPERQLRLFDIRLRQTEIHAFGWKQESSESQSALINQAWSPDGLYITSGSADPMIHLFDIRYHDRKPSQSIKAHNKRVFKAVWHYSHPLLISISSDLQIGLHKIQ